MVVALWTNGWNRRHGLDSDGNIRCFQSGRIRSQAERVGTPARGLHDNLSQSVEQAAMIALFRFVRTVVTVAGADDGARPRNLKGHRQIGGGNFTALRIHGANGHGLRVRAVARQRFAVGNCRTVAEQLAGNVSPNAGK